MSQMKNIFAKPLISALPCINRFRIIYWVLYLQSVWVYYHWNYLFSRYIIYKRVPNMLLLFTHKCCEHRRLRVSVLCRKTECPSTSMVRYGIGGSLYGYIWEWVLIIYTKRIGNFRIN